MVCLIIEIIGTINVSVSVHVIVFVGTIPVVVVVFAGRVICVAAGSICLSWVSFRWKCYDCYETEQKCKMIYLSHIMSNFLNKVRFIGPNVVYYFIEQRFGYFFPRMKSGCSRKRSMTRDLRLFSAQRLVMSWRRLSLAFWNRSSWERRKATSLLCSSRWV